MFSAGEPTPSGSGAILAETGAEGASLPVMSICRQARGHNSDHSAGWLYTNVRQQERKEERRKNEEEVKEKSKTGEKKWRKKDFL